MGLTRLDFLFEYGYTQINLVTISNFLIKCFEIFRGINIVAMLHLPLICVTKSAKLPS